MPPPRITTVLIEANKGEQTYGVYLMTRDGICDDQEIFSYDDKDQRSTAYAAAQKKARDWATVDRASPAGRTPRTPMRVTAA